MPGVDTRSTKSVDAGEETSCGLCCKAIKDEESESLILCEGPCGQWFHRYCAGVTTMKFEQLSKSEETFFCYACFQQAYREKVSILEDRITSLIVELEEHIKTSVKFAIQTIITSTNLNYSIVCISVYDKNSSFFNISCSNP